MSTSRSIEKKSTSTTWWQHRSRGRTRRVGLAIASVAVLALAAACGSSGSNNASSAGGGGGGSVQQGPSSGGVSTVSTPLGTILTNTSGMTLYGFAIDSEGQVELRRHLPAVLAAGLAGIVGAATRQRGREARSDHRNEWLAAADGQRLAGLHLCRRPRSGQRHRTGPRHVGRPVVGHRHRRHVDRVGDWRVVNERLDDVGIQPRRILSRHRGRPRSDYTIRFSRRPRFTLWCSSTG